MTRPREWERRADDLAAEAIEAGEPTAWFDRLYAEGTRGETSLAWDWTEPNPVLVEWAQGRGGAGRRAVVVGCGFGRDAEFLGRLGYDTTAFDISPTVVDLVRKRFPDSPVHYEVADLLDPPAALLGAFELVVESYTVQAMPVTLRERATRGVAELVAPGGTLVVVAAARGAGEELPAGPPWPLDRGELDAFARGGLESVRVEWVDEPPRWRAEFRRAAHSD